jgi:hypothetical protein
VAIIHDGDSTQPWDIYTPVHYDFAGAVHEFRYISDRQSNDRIRVTDYPSDTVEFDLLGLPFKNLIVVRSLQRSAQEIVAQVRGDRPARGRSGGSSLAGICETGARRASDLPFLHWR